MDGTGSRVVGWGWLGGCMVSGEWLRVKAHGGCAYRANMLNCRTGWGDATVVFEGGGGAVAVRAALHPPGATVDGAHG